MIPCTNTIAKCKASCCGIVPFKKDTYYKYSNSRWVPTTELLEIQDVIIPVTGDLICIFLNRETYTCNIYPDRPNLCKKFGFIEGLYCIWYDQYGTKRSRSERRRFEMITDRNVLMKIKRLRNTISNKQGLINDADFKNLEFYKDLQEWL